MGMLCTFKVLTVRSLWDSSSASLRGTDFQYTTEVKLSIFQICCKSSQRLLLESFLRGSHINLPLGQSHQWRCCSVLRFYEKHMFVCGDIRLEWLRVRALPSARRNRLTASAKRILPPWDVPLINTAKTDEPSVPLRAPPPPLAHPHPLIHLLILSVLSPLLFLTICHRCKKFVYAVCPWTLVREENFQEACLCYSLNVITLTINLKLFGERNMLTFIKLD